MKRFLIVGSCAALILTLVPSSAFARGPKWEFQPISAFTVRYCGFPIRVKALVNKEFTKVTTSGDITIFLTTGRLTGEFTNILSGASISLNASGPAYAAFHSDGSGQIRQFGHTVQFFPADLAATFGVPPVYLWDGEEVFDLPTDGLPTLTAHGHLMVDICRALG